MKSILFIGTQKSGSSREAIKSAEFLGYYTILITDKQQHKRQRKEFPDVHLMLYCKQNDIEKMRKYIIELQEKSIEICAIVSFIEQYIITASQLAQEYGVNKFTLEAFKKMSNKVSSREAIKDTTYSPNYIKLDYHQTLGLKEIKQLLPVIIKSPESTGSKDVYFVETYKEYIDRIKQLRDKYLEKPILVEEYIQGDQYLVETLVEDDIVNIIAVIKQEIIYTNDHYIITGYNLMLDLNDQFYDGIEKIVTDVIKLHGLRTGPCHLELRETNKGWKLIEVNPRISGGGMNQFIEIGLGINLVKETIKLALGENIDLNPKYKRYTSTRYKISEQEGILERITGQNRARTSLNTKFVYVAPRKGTLLIKPTSMGHRYAYVIASGNDYNDAIKNANEAAKEITFHLKEN